MPTSSESPSEDEHSKFELSSDSSLETTVQRVGVAPIDNRIESVTFEDALTLKENDCIGRYTIIKTLGSGGFGVVYLAQDPKLNRKVAIKMSRALDIFSEKLRTSLVDEARAAASLDHPNIIRVFDVDHWQDRTYVVMELVEGKSLADVIAQGEKKGVAAHF